VQLPRPFVSLSFLGIFCVIFVASSLLLKSQSTVGQTPAQSHVPQWQIAAGGNPKFEVASVKQNTSGQTLSSSNIPLDGRDLFAPTGGLFSATNYTLGNFVIFAYKLFSYQSFVASVELPNWTHRVRYDIQARAIGNPTKDQFRIMMQALLADRFKLRIHYEIRQLPVFTLVLDRPGKLGPQLRNHLEEPPCSTVPKYSNHIAATIAGGFPESCGALVYWVESGHNHAGGRDMTMAMIASQANGTMVDSFDRPIVDGTGLAGKYDFAMEYTPEPNGPPRQDSILQPDQSGPTYLEALKNQLGLKLVSQTGPVEVMVIDHIEEPSPN
jgi:uncharacterized protein (TIGR03435 family)